MLFTASQEYRNRMVSANVIESLEHAWLLL
jgi:hypothetical protein